MSDTAIVALAVGVLLVILEWGWKRDYVAMLRRHQRSEAAAQDFARTLRQIAHDWNETGGRVNERCGFEATNALELHPEYWQEAR